MNPHRKSNGRKWLIAWGIVGIILTFSLFLMRYGTMFQQSSFSDGIDQVAKAVSSPAVEVTHFILSILMIFWVLVIVGIVWYGNFMRQKRY